MRTLDDFAFVKEAGFNNVYKQISDTLDLYNKVPLRIYCEQYRNPLDAAIEAIYYLAGIKDAMVPNGMSGDNIGRLKRVLPENVFIKSGGENLLTSLNATCSPYHHKSGWPPEEEWNKDAEKCYLLMVEICKWLITFKNDITQYLKENGPIQWKQVLAKKKDELQALPENNCVAKSFPSDFTESILSQLDNINDYKKSLESDLAFYYNKMYQAASEHFDDFLHLFDDIQLPEELESLWSSTTSLARISPMLVATSEVLFYDAIIHPILFFHDWSPEILTKELAPKIPKIPFDDIYKGLLYVNSYAVSKVISTLSCSQSQIESLQTAFKNKNETSFTNSLKKVTCDLTALHTLASFMPLVIKRDYGMMLKEDVTLEWILSSDTLVPDFLKKESYMEVLRKPNFDNLSQNKRLEKASSLMHSNYQMLKEGLTHYFLMIMTMVEDNDWQTAFFSFEKDYLYRLLENDDVKSFLSSIDYKGKVPEQSNIELPVSDSDNAFRLPEDFFSGSYPRDARNTDKHFNLDYDVEKCGGGKFAQLINMIASWGFISSSDSEKQKLVYILSGRLKPNGYEGEGLEWIDNGYGYELLYIIKYITGNEKGKYEKARKLFHGPQWLGKGDFKDQADYADAGFRRALNDIYPDICIIKGHVETVREPVRESTQFHIPDNPIKQ